MMVLVLGGGCGTWLWYLIVVHGCGSGCYGSVCIIGWWYIVLVVHAGCTWWWYLVVVGIMW